MFNRKIIRERKREKRQGGGGRRKKEMIMLNELSFTKKIICREKVQLEGFNRDEVANIKSNT